MNIMTFYGSSPIHHPFIKLDGLSYTRAMFWSWLEAYEPDIVTRKVMEMLMYKYDEGDKEPLFKKMQQLIRDEHYELCIIFHDMFIYTGINEEYKHWEETT